MELIGRLGPEDIQSGIMPDPKLTNAKLWSAGHDVVFAEGAVQPAPGQTALFAKNVAIPILGMATKLVAGRPTLYYGTRGALYKWDESAGVSTVGTGYTGANDATPTTRATCWSFAPWGAWMVAANGVNAVQVDEGSGFGALAGAPGAARVLVNKTPFLLALNTSNDPAEVAWCHRDDIEDWTPAADNLAGSLILRELDSEITAGLLLGDSVAVYSENSMTRVTFVGVPNVFGAEPAVKGFGAVGVNSVCAVGAMHFGFGPNGIWVSDGFSFTYTDAPLVREFVYDRLNFAQRSKIVAWYDRAEDLVVFYFPTGERNDQAVAWSPKYQCWSIYSYGRRSAVSGTEFKYGISGGENGQVWYQSVGSAVPSNGGWIGLGEDKEGRAGFGVGGFGRHGFGGVIRWSD